jgi:hypothetical protein
MAEQCSLHAPVSSLILNLNERSVLRARPFLSCQSAACS